MLNKSEGEFIPQLGQHHVVPNEKWSSTEMFRVACEAAAENFITAGALRPIRLSEQNVLAQEYHIHGKIVFIFWMKIKDVDHYYHFTCTPEPKMLYELTLTGMWPATVLPGLPN